MLSWSCDPSNPVGSEYIIMEKAKGTALGDVWYRLPGSSKHKFIRQVVDLEAKLVSVPFPAHGCIYYAQDLPTAYSKSQLLLCGDGLKKFCIGPAVDPVLWSDGRAEMGLCWGPCEFLIFPNFIMALLTFVVVYDRASACRLCDKYWY